MGDPPEKVAYIAKHVILKALGDDRSSRFYQLVAAKIPEQVIRETLSEVRADGARSPAKLFTYKIQRYALTQQKPCDRCASVRSFASSDRTSIRVGYHSRAPPITCCGPADFACSWTRLARGGCRGSKRGNGGKHSHFANRTCQRPTHAFCVGQK